MIVTAILTRGCDLTLPLHVSVSSQDIDKSSAQDTFQTLVAVEDQGRVKHPPILPSYTCCIEYCCLKRVPPPANWVGRRLIQVCWHGQTNHKSTTLKANAYIYAQVTCNRAVYCTPLHRSRNPNADKGRGWVCIGFESFFANVPCSIKDNEALMARFIETLLRFHHIRD